MAAVPLPSLLRVVTTKKNDVVTWKLEVYDGMLRHFQVITARRHGRISSRTMPQPKARTTPSLRIRWSIIQRANRSLERTLSKSVRRKNMKLWKYVTSILSHNNLRYIGCMQENLTKIFRRNSSSESLVHNFIYH